MIEMKVEDCLRPIGGECISGTEEKVFRGVSIDSRTLKENELFFCICGDRFDGHDFIAEARNKKASAIVLSDSSKAVLRKNAAISVIRVADTVNALQELARFHRKQMPVKVVGVTGTNGKSSTKEMIASVAEIKFKTIKTRGNLNNHIGLPLNMFRLSKNDEVAVIEMGMSSIGEIGRLAEIARPQIGVLTNIGEGHLANLKTLKNVQAAKGELYDALSEQGTAIVNADDPLVFELAKSVRAKVITYGIYNEADVRAVDIRQAENKGFSLNIHFFKQTFSLHLPFIGTCNIYNALAAMATGYSLGIEPNDIKNGLSNTKLLPNRYEITKHQGATIINDAYNANPSSMQEALKTLASYRCKGRRFFVIGDMLELGDPAVFAHIKLGAEVAKHSIDYLVAIGDLSAHAAKSSVASGMDKKNVAVASEHKCAIAFLKKHVRPGDCLLVKGSRGSKMEEIVRRFTA